jgi:hypothetical protein
MKLESKHYSFLLRLLNTPNLTFGLSECEVAAQTHKILETLAAPSPKARQRLRRNGAAVASQAAAPAS